MFGLEAGLFILLIVCLLAACAFEFVNGFHDTANAVATVIYTNSLKPWHAVVWSGFCNFLGVFAGGIGVAMGIVNLLPVESLIDQNIYHSIAMVLALLLSAIIWNVGTWYYGLPSSSSHTLIGSILGVGLAFSLLPDNVSGAAVNWKKAEEIGFSLLLSPIFGFSMTVFLMFFLKRVVSQPEIFKEPHKTKAPPMWVRVILILTCTGVSFSHGSNDGQKGVGLVMLILIGILPVHFALNSEKDITHIMPSLQKIELVVNKIDSTKLSYSEKIQLEQIQEKTADLKTYVSSGAAKTAKADPNNKGNFRVRKDILVISKNIEKLLGSENLLLTETDRNTLKELALSKDKVADENIRSYTDYSPLWVLGMISLSLGLGTMIGWKRIVTTIGEKIGKQHLTYAQGASAEMVAALTVSLATKFSLPVSTTHVLSSGIAGSMVASKGIKNLQAGTIKNILLAWLLTLPVSILLSGTLFLLLRWIL